MSMHSEVPEVLQTDRLFRGLLAERRRLDEAQSRWWAHVERTHAENTRRSGEWERASHAAMLAGGEPPPAPELLPLPPGTVAVFDDARAAIARRELALLEEHGPDLLKRLAKRREPLDRRAAELRAQLADVEAEAQVIRATEERLRAQVDERYTAAGWRRDSVDDDWRPPTPAEEQPMPDRRGHRAAHEAERLLHTRAPTPRR